MSAPTVTLLMPVFNGEAHLAEAVESVLAQTFADFELLVLDDGSTDSSGDILDAFRDRRIRRVRNARNLGLAETLNKGLELAQGRYIARMDCDDVCLPGRLERQVRFMERHPEIGVLGTWFEKTDGATTVTVEVPVGDAEIRFFLIFENTFMHASILLSKAVLDRANLRYDPALKYGQDYDLWVRCARHTRLANLPEILMRYRCHPDNASHRFRDEQRRAADQARCLHLRSFGLVPAPAERELHLDVIGFRFKGDFDRLAAAARWVSALAAAVRDTLDIPEDLVYRELGSCWYGACGALADRGFPVWRLFMSSPVGRKTDWPWKAKLLLRSLLRRKIEACPS
jgi:glycosyltransferase involved in cell wall biosynthesis